MAVLRDIAAKIAWEPENVSACMCLSFCGMHLAQICDN
jgi:hypothetical protein